ncbi:MAG: VacJ family lipoprotein [Pseudomonadota bacterium]|mgnify:CR=1 FL=1
MPEPDSNKTTRMSWIISLRPFRRWLFSGLCVLALSACGTVPNRPAEDGAPSNGNAQTGAANGEQDTSRDPLEGFNRAMYTFNDKFDRYLLKPVAKGYRAIMPKPVSKSISNFFGNLHDPGIMLNNLLQGKPGQAASDLGRFLVNSTVGIAGLFDVATKMGLQKHNEDFGQTLAVWGVGDGPYLVLPFFGPSNMRDGPSLIVDWETYPPNHMEEHSTSDKLYVVEVIDKRAQLLDASDILEQAAGQDPYVFVREASRQSRRSQIYDGNPPQAAPPPGLFEDDAPPPAPRPGNGATQSR